MTDKIDQASPDIEVMQPYWQMVRTIMGGAPAMRKAGEAYLPRFEAEGDKDYKLRCSSAPFTNIFRDIVEGLAAKPFSKEVGVEAGSSRLTDLVEDVDGEGNHLSVFASNFFFQAIGNAVDFVLVDYPRTSGEMTVEQERKKGVRPYWVRIPVENVLAVRSSRNGGQQVITHFRYFESALVVEGYEEKSVRRIRVFDRPALEAGGYGLATYTLLEEQQNGDKKEWVQIEDGPISIGVIPIVPLVLGRREGASWVVNPPLRDAAYLQVEHFQKESGLKYASDLTAFPMLAGNGIEPPSDGVVVPIGPKTVLWAPPHGSTGNHGEWKFIEPGAQSLTFLAEQLKETAKELRELGRQPLTANSGNLTVITTAFAAQKGNSAVQAWALLLKDALENALKLTAMWIGEAEEPQVEVHTDFAIELENGETFETVLAMYQANLISAEALIVEAKRRNILSGNYDELKDAEAMLNASDETDERLSALPAA